MLFGTPREKNSIGSEAYSSNGVIQKSLSILKERNSELVLITDVCLCGYTDHGHCGIINNGEIDNDRTIEILGKIAVSHAKAGADMVAPSAMMDGQIKAIRESLDEAGFTSTGIMGYSAKFASSFYDPFRDAAKSDPKFKDRKGYQMDPSNAREALKEISLDVNEGADIVMIKPALPYLDIIHRTRTRFDIPVAAFCVSGEYAMVKAADNNGWLNGEKSMLEILLCIKRAGADMIITYFADEAAEIILKKSNINKTSGLK